MMNHTVAPLSFLAIGDLLLLAMRDDEWEWVI
jgi:hypothetical protein